MLGRAARSYPRPPGGRYRHGGADLPGVRTALVVVHGTEGYRVTELLAAEGVGVITGPILTDRSKPELAGLTIENPARLAKAGVDRHLHRLPVTPIQYLPLCAAIAVRGGLEPEEALRAITLGGARLAGVAHRVGSLTPGKDADVVVTSGHPLEWTEVWSMSLSTVSR